MTSFLPMVQGCPERVRIDDNAVQLTIPCQIPVNQFCVTFVARSSVEAVTLYNLLSMAIKHMRVDLLTDIDEVDPDAGN